jgi:hypothetical protein
VSDLTLADKLIEIDRALDDAAIPHAFGGAIALAYCTGDPRGTVDIDLNVFVESTEARRVLAALPPGVTSGGDDVAAAGRHGQVRILWATTPLDLFFNYHPFHSDVARRARRVPFIDTMIPVISCEDLVVFKAFFARTQDWADIEAMVATDAIDNGAACERVAGLLGVDHPSYVRLVDTVQSPVAQGQSPPPLPSPRRG